MLFRSGDVRVIGLPTPRIGNGSYRYDDWNIRMTPLDENAYADHENLPTYYSTYNWKRIANGFSGYIPFFYKRIFTEMQAFPSQRSVDLLRGLGMDYVIWQWDLVDAERRGEYEERLSSSPGLALERDFANEVVYRVLPGDAASPEDLAASIQAPYAIPGGEGFNLGILVSNGSANPFVMADEDPQPFLLSFFDPEGNTIYKERGNYRAPFFLEPGDEVSLPLEIKGTPGEGKYVIKLDLESGVLGGRRLECELEVRNPQELIGSGYLDGRVALKGDTTPLEIPVPNGLYPLVLEVKNTGDNLLRSWKGGHVEEGYPYGVVYLGVKWSLGEEVVWEEQGGFLPSDLSAEIGRAHV